MADTESDCTGRVTLGVVVLAGFAALVYYIAVFGMSREIRQNIDGRLNIDGHPAIGQKIALAGDGYNAHRQTTTTSRDGAFSFVRPVALGRVAVIVQRDTLCLFERGGWKPVWHGSYGPAPNRLRFACDKGGENPWHCTLTAPGWATPLETQPLGWGRCPSPPTEDKFR